MGVYTFVCRRRSGEGGEWNGKERGEDGTVEASAGTTYDLQRKLVNASLSKDNSAAPVSSSFSLVTPSSAVFQVIIGGGSGGGFIGGGADPAASSGGGAAAEAPAAETKVEEKDESDDDLGFSLFD